jgi:hypothetical protein
MVKFGKRLVAQLHAPWAEHYVPYKSLKQIVNAISAPADPVGATESRAEGDFLTAVLSAIDVANRFYQVREADYAERLEHLAKTLAAPDSWLLIRPEYDLAEGTEPDFPQVVAKLEGGMHVPVEQREALDAFLTLCSEVDLLRKFSVRSALQRPSAHLTTLFTAHSAPPPRPMNGRTPSPPPPACLPLRPPRTSRAILRASADASPAQPPRHLLPSFPPVNTARAVPPPLCNRYSTRWR